MSKFEIGKLAQDLGKVKDQIATELIETSRDFFVEQFEGEKWLSKKWKQVKRNKSGSKSKYAGFPILVNTGSLRNSVLAPHMGKTWTSCFLEVQNSYAEYHNNPEESGGRLAKRQFIAHNSTILGKKQLFIIEKHLDRLFI